MPLIWALMRGFVLKRVIREVRKPANQERAKRAFASARGKVGERRRRRP